MVNKYEEFYKIKPGKSKTEKDIDNIIDSFSDFKRIYGIDAALKGILRLLLIVKGTYIFDPELGSGIHKYLFEPADKYTLDAIRSEIDQVIRGHRVERQITHKVLFFKNKKGFRVDITIQLETGEKRLSVDVDESLLESLP